MTLQDLQGEQKPEGIIPDLHQLEELKLMARAHKGTPSANRINIVPLGTRATGLGNS